MALPALPAIASFAGKSLASLGIWQGGKAAFRGLKNQAAKVVPFIKRNPAAAAKAGGAAGVLGGAYATISDGLSAVGIESNQLQLVITGGLALAAVAAVGQLFDIQLGGDQ
jgi:hypothetical protein